MHGAGGGVGGGGGGLCQALGPKRPRLLGFWYPRRILYRAEALGQMLLLKIPRRLDPFEESFSGR